MVTDYTAQALTTIRTAEAERRLEVRRRTAERHGTAAASRPGAGRPVAPSRTGFATLLFGVLHGSGSPAHGLR